MPPPSAHLAALPAAFYDRAVLEAARDLIGCGFSFQGVGGVIVETEAYAPGDPCSHGYRGRTARNAVMFGPPGHLYVYFTYGMHFCCNLVCGVEGVPAAVLLRALEPTSGLEVMMARRGADDRRALCSGPAKLSQALAIGLAQNGIPAWRGALLVAPRPGTGPGTLDGLTFDDPAMWRRNEPRIVATQRIGVGDDGKPWRFVDADSHYLSRPLPRRHARRGDGA
jgi:DNA-3-methyladenine glycosylase